MVFHEFSGNGHGIVQLLPFSQGRILVSVGQDDQVVLWNLKSLEEIYRYEMEDSTAKMGFLADRQIYLWNKESLTLASLNYTGQAFASFK